MRSTENDSCASSTATEWRAAPAGIRSPASRPTSRSDGPPDQQHTPGRDPPGVGLDPDHPGSVEPKPPECRPLAGAPRPLPASRASTPGRSAAGRLRRQWPGSCPRDGRSARASARPRRPRRARASGRRAPRPAASRRVRARHVRRRRSPRGSGSRARGSPNPSRRPPAVRGRTRRSSCPAQPWPACRPAPGRCLRRGTRRPSRAGPARGRRHARRPRPSRRPTPSRRSSRRR